MSDSPIGQNAPAVQPIPVTMCDERKASEAFARFSALRQAQQAVPSLIDEECFQILLSDAQSSFMSAFESLCGGDE